MWWTLQESNLGRADLQSTALPTELRIRVGWVTGLEPTTSRATTWRSIRLSYTHQMAYLPLVDTMHHALKAWCIFYWFHFDSPGRWGQKGQNAECSPRSLLSAVPEAFCRQIISGMFLVNVQKQRIKTHACDCFYFVVRYLAPAPFPCRSIGINTEYSIVRLICQFLRFVSQSTCYLCEEV